MKLGRLFNENWVLFIILFYVIVFGGFAVGLTIYDVLIR